MVQLVLPFFGENTHSKAVQVVRVTRRVTRDRGRAGVQESCPFGVIPSPLAIASFAVLLCTSPNRCILS